MDIRYKPDHSIIRENVEPAILNEDAGWIKKHGDVVNFYPPTHWEPVEEWVRIEVPKNQIGRFNTMCSYVNGEFLKWRYPQ